MHHKYFPSNKQKIMPIHMCTAINNNIIMCVNVLHCEKMISHRAIKFHEDSKIKDVTLKTN